MKINISGPYTYGPNEQKMFVSYYTDDCVLIKNTIVDLTTYNKNKNLGLYDHEEVNFKNLLKDNIDFITIKKNTKEIIKRVKRSKYIEKTSTQIVIKINENTDKKYYIITNLNTTNRESYLVERKNTALIISNSSTGGIFKEYYFDLEKAVRIRLVPKYKRLFWITESGILVSRRTFKVLSQYLNKKGYYVHASKMGGRKGILIAPRIHQLVAQAFVYKNPDTTNELIVNHIDGVKTNNFYTNLEWVTYSENIKHAHDLELIVNKKGTEAPDAKFTFDQVIEIRNDKKNNNTPYRKLASKYKVNKNTIRDIVLGNSYKNVPI